MREVIPEEAIQRTIRDLPLQEATRVFQVNDFLDHEQRKAFPEAFPVNLTSRLKPESDHGPISVMD